MAYLVNSPRTTVSRPIQLSAIHSYYSPSYGPSIAITLRYSINRSVPLLFTFHAPATATILHLNSSHISFCYEAMVITLHFPSLSPAWNCTLTDSHSLRLQHHLYVNTPQHMPNIPHNHIIKLALSWDTLSSLTACCNRSSIALSIGRCGSAG